MREGKDRGWNVGQAYALPLHPSMTPPATTDDEEVLEEQESVIQLQPRSEEQLPGCTVQQSEEETDQSADRSLRQPEDEFEPKQCPGETKSIIRCFRRCAMTRLATSPTN